MIESRTGAFLPGAMFRFQKFMNLGNWGCIQDWAEQDVDVDSVLKGWIYYVHAVYILYHVMAYDIVVVV